MNIIQYLIQHFNFCCISRNKNNKKEDLEFANNTYEYYKL